MELDGSKFDKDPVVGLLTCAGLQIPEFEALMRTVADRNASHQELKEFQESIDELERITGIGIS